MDTAPDIKKPKLLEQLQSKFSNADEVLEAYIQNEDIKNLRGETSSAERFLTRSFCLIALPNKTIADAQRYIRATFKNIAKRKIKDTEEDIIWNTAQAYVAALR